MIDSINFIIRNIKNIDLKHLNNLKIRCYPLESGIGYHFIYKTVQFQYYKVSNVLFIKTNTHYILNKKHILLSDKEIYKEKINKILVEIIGDSSLQLELNRIDFYVDIYVGNLVKIYIDLLKKHKDSYKYMKRKKIYKTSSYIKTKVGQTKMNMYDKYTCVQDKLIKQAIKPKIDSKEYLGTIRLEIQNTKEKIKNLYVKDGVEKILDNYWNKDMMNLLFFDFLEGYLYHGDYYKLKEAKKIIKSSDYSQNWKIKLSDFLFKISIYGINEIFERKIYCEDTIKSYIDKLNILKINPITIDKELPYNKLENILTLARATAEKEYFK